MPPKTKVSKEEILSAAVELVRQNGENALNARNIARNLGCSTQPIFSNFIGMDELRAAVKERANILYQNYLAPICQPENTRRIKQAVWRISVLRGRKKNCSSCSSCATEAMRRYATERESIRPIIDIIKKNLGLDEEQAFLFSYGDVDLRSRNRDYDRYIVTMLGRRHDKRYRNRRV